VCLFPAGFVSGIFADICILATMPVYLALMNFVGVHEVVRIPMLCTVLSKIEINVLRVA